MPDTKQQPHWTNFAAFALAALLLAPASAFAQANDTFFKGKQVTMLVGTAAGGGYDTYARTLVP